MCVVKEIFSRIREYQQEAHGVVDHPTTLLRVKTDFATLPDPLKRAFIDWVNTHQNAHLIDVDRDDRENPHHLVRTFSYITLQKP